MFSTTTSACSASRSRISRPSSLFRLSVMARLLRCRFWKSEPSRRPTSSPASLSSGGGSTRITSAPQSASVRTQEGPARAKVRSMTLKRDNGSEGALCGVSRADVSTGLCMLISPGARDERRLLALELRLALFHEGAAAFAEILRVHALHADLLDRGHVALVRVFQHLRDGDLGGLDRQRRIARDRAGDLHRRIPQLAVWKYPIDQ